MGYNEGFESGLKTSGQNPFGMVLSRVKEAQARKISEYKKDQDDLKELDRVFKILGKKHDNDVSLKQEEQFLKDYEPAKSDEEAVSFKDTPFESIAKQGRYKKKSDVDELLKQENLGYMKSINQRMAGGGQGETDLVYRRGDTGEEVSKDIAEQSIANGDRNFLITQRNTSKSGTRETPLIKTPDLTKEEKEYVNASKRIGEALTDMSTRFKEIAKEKGSADWKKFQAQLRLPFGAEYSVIKDQNLQYIKSSIDKVKADIPFLRGGKQLTNTEARRIDILLNPFGKSDETIQRDIERFRSEFDFGEKLMIGGVSAISREKNIQSQSSKTITLPSGKTINITGQ